MDNAAQDVGSAEVHAVGVGDRGHRRVAVARCALEEGPVRTVLVVLLDVLSEHELKVASSEDNTAVETLAPDGAHYPFGDGVGPRRPEGP